MLHARVPRRAFERRHAVERDRSTSTWSRQPSPTPMPSYPGLLRWTPVEGATATRSGSSTSRSSRSSRLSRTSSTSASSTRSTARRAWTATIRWRIRALRADADIDSARTASRVTTYGPWSPRLQLDATPTSRGGPITLLGTASDVVSAPARPGRAPADARLRLQRRPDVRRSERRALPRLRVHGSSVPEPRLHRARRRQPGLRAAALRPARPAQVGRRHLGGARRHTSRTSPREPIRQLLAHTTDIESVRRRSARRRDPTTSVRRPTPTPTPGRNGAARRTTAPQR